MIEEIEGDALPQKRSFPVGMPGMGSGSRKFWLPGEGPGRLLM